jgi:hypothetical protein
VFQSNQQRPNKALHPTAHSLRYATLMAADELGHGAERGLIREVRQAEISDNFPMERLMFLTKTLGSLS